MEFMYEEKSLFINDIKETVASINCSDIFAHLCQALGTSPVPFGDIMEWWNQTECVVAIIAAITQQQLVFFTASPTHQTHVLFHLQKHTQNKEHLETD